MDPHHEISWLHTGFHLMLDKWQITLAVMGGLIGWIMWWLHSVFATKETLIACRKDVAKTMDKFKDSEVEAHDEIKADVQEIKADVQFIKGFLKERNGK